MSDDKPCTCHPSEAPVPCQKKYAFSECELSALRAELAAERERVTKLREALEYVRERVHRINWLAGLDAPIREQVYMARDAINTALKETGDDHD